MKYKMILLKISFLLLSALLGSVSLNKIHAQDMEIKDLQLKFPQPSIPFYHFEMKINLPRSSIIEVKIVVNNDTLRFTDLYSASMFEKMEIDKPAIAHRPPSGYALSEDTIKYKTPYVIGWLRWQPGHRYKIEVLVRMKAGGQKSNNDVILSASKTVIAPNDAPVFSLAWKNYKAVVLSETEGIDRENEPVEVLLPFYPDQAENIKHDIRVVAIDPKTHVLTEIPSQVYDINEFLEKDNLEPLQKGEPNRKIPLFYPTITAQLTFLASVPARSSRVFLVFYNNKDAIQKDFTSDLIVQGNTTSGMEISNNFYKAILDPHSRALTRIMLHSKPDAPLYNQAETNGAIQWNPDIYSPPEPWAHTSDWVSPHTKSVVGPVVVKTNTWGNINHYWGILASIKYRFYPDMPYFIMSTTMRMEKTVNTLALRNGEMVFKRDLLNRVAWYDALRDTVVVYNLETLPTLTDLTMPVDVPWITFYNDSTGIGFAGIQLGYNNSGIEYSPRLLNPYFYVTTGPWVYWARALSVSYVSSNHQQMIPVLNGNNFSEKWAYLIYEVERNKNSEPYAPVLKWQKKLTHPLKIQLVEKVDNRVSNSIYEIMSNGKSPWEK
jgi:hypothetical protein